MEGRGVGMDRGGGDRRFNTIIIAMKWFQTSH